MFFTFTSLFTISAITQNSSASVDSRMGEKAKNVMAEDEEEAKSTKLDPVKKKDKDISPEQAFIFPVTKQTVIFQGILLLAAVYYAMLMTNWGDPVIKN
jgi:hypothetical protein